MASILETETKPRVHYFDPSETKKTILPKTLYQSHIVEVNTKVVDVRGNYKARVYNFKIEIADAVKNITYKDKDGKEFKGTSFVGTKIKSKGIFLFLNPENGDKFQANPGANDVYLRFCETIGIECKEEQVEIDGETRTLTAIPELIEADIVGKPVLSYVDYNSFKNSEGETIRYLQAKGFEKWVEGEDRELDLEEIPF